MRSEKRKATRRRQICVESQRSRKERRVSMHGGGPNLFEAEWNKQNM